MIIIHVVQISVCLMQQISGRNFFPAGGTVVAKSAAIIFFASYLLTYCHASKLR